MNSTSCAIVFPKGERSSIPRGAFNFFPSGTPINRMQTVHEVRRDRLLLLVAKYKGMANLCEALGFARNDTARLTRIANANIRHERGGKPYVLGDELARQIEDRLKLDRGWMDTPTDRYPLADERISHVLKVMEAMPGWQRDQAVKIVDTLAEHKTNGTDG